MRAAHDASLMAQGLSLSSSYLKSVLPPVAAHYGMPVPMLLERAGIPLTIFEDPQAMVSFERVAVLFLTVLNRTGDEALGLRVGSTVQPRSYQVMGYAILGSDTLRDAVDRLIRYEKLVGKLGHTELQVNGSDCEVRWHAPISGVWACYLKEAAIAGWINFARSLVDVIPPYTVCFDHGLRGDIAPYHARLGEDVRFDQPFTGIRLPVSALSLSFKTADPGLCAMMDREASLALSQFDERINVIPEVRAALARILPDGEPTLERLGETLGMSARVLQDRLKGHGTHFKALVDDVRKWLAVDYIERQTLSLMDIGFLLGFSEQSAFSRAFRRWYGTSPQQYAKGRLSLP